MAKFLKYSLSSFLFCFLLNTTEGQETKTDSLLEFIKSGNDDSSKVNSFNALFSEYEFKDTLKAEMFLNKAFDLSKKIGDKKGLALTYTNRGFLAEDKGHYLEAIKNHLEALRIREILKDKSGVASAYNNIAIEYYYLGNFPEALKYNFLSLKMREAIGDKKNAAGSYNNIGTVYFGQGDNKSALKNYLLALQINTELKNRNWISINHNNIGNVYNELVNYPEALKSHFASLKIKEEMGNIPGVASSYSNIGLIYSRTGNYPEAIEYIQNALKINEEMGDKASIALNYLNLGNAFFDQKEFQKANSYYTKAKEVSTEIGLKEILRTAYASLSFVDSAQGNYHAAFENRKLFFLYRDSLENEETRKKTIQSQMTYDFEKKEAVAQAEHKKELETHELLADEKSRKQRLILIFVLGSLLMVLIFAGFVFRSLKLTRKQKNTIENQKNIVEHQKHLVEEKQKEIIDSINYARRIQNSLLPTERYIEKELKRLKSEI